MYMSRHNALLFAGKKYAVHMIAHLLTNTGNIWGQSYICPTNTGNIWGQILRPLWIRQLVISSKGYDLAR
ncbi:unnamed protein product [Onchocerca flexuosa]|uniref:Peptidase M12A domain-containing protein n=1 Tax=Onchocerca flexuosa TaxID=387005 RepID=A0A183HQA9_9BILA|nr:unnamed protein product [Onchocerca flexuosa]